VYDSIFYSIVLLLTADITAARITLTDRLTARQLDYSIDELSVSEELFGCLYWLPEQTLKQVACPLQVNTTTFTSQQSTNVQHY